MRPPRQYEYTPRRVMTVCIAAMCQDRKAIVLAADKMIGVGYIESEPDIEKYFQIHRDWWVMIAGDDIDPAFDIVERVKNRLGRGASASAAKVTEVVTEAYMEKRDADAESLYLKPLGWTLKKFNTAIGRSVIPDQLRVELYAKIMRHQLNLSLLVAGFQRSKGYIFHIGNRTHGIAKRCDIPGFCAIGSGGIGAEYMMFYRDYSSNLPVRWAVYVVLEAKLFGEQASGVGGRTDMFVIQPGGNIFKLPDDDVIEEVLIKKLFDQLKPQNLKQKHVDVLNQIGELKKFAKLKTKRVHGELGIFA